MILKILLYPFGILYGLIAEIRNAMFRYGILKKTKLPCKVISVGNLCAGGTGKTPFVIGLIEILAPHFSHICVISRGYGRKSSGAKIVSVQGKFFSDIQVAGDEPFIIAKRFKDISVVVAEKRLEGFELIKAHDPDLIILDDAFQHQFVHRDINIVLMNGYEPYISDFMLPLGKLREPIWNLNRADYLVETKTFSDSYHGNIPHSYLPYQPVVLNEETTFSKPFVLISGIAKPNHFEELVVQKGYKFSKHFKFKDHHNYSKTDFKSLTDEPILTTEKDYFKLLELKLPNPIVYLKLDFDFPETLTHWMVRQLKN